MRINRSVLLKNARNAVAERVYQDRRLTCAYLTGSLLTEDVLLGGAADIDLIIVHAIPPPQPREISRISDDIHLDIAHYSQADYVNLRQLRLNPWLGSYLCESSFVLHDTRHWFEYTQASVCAQFMRPNFVLQRARPFIESARQCWMNLKESSHVGTPEQVWSYFKALENAANAIAVLNGVPLTERRFLLTFPDRARAIQRPGLAAGLEDLFFLPLATDVWESWLSGWREAFAAAGSAATASPRLSRCRLSYYESAAKLFHVEHPAAAVWLLMRTWSQALCHLPAENPHRQGWMDACKAIALDEEHFPERLNIMDAYLDNIEETLDAWAKENGVETLTEML